MKVQELENYINSNYLRLVEECRGFCVEGDVGRLLKLEELRLYEGCEYCLIKTAVDHLNMPALVIPLRDGRVIELIRLHDYILELSDGMAQLHSVDEFLEVLSDYLDFGLLSRDEVVLISEWLGKGNTSLTQ